MRPHTYEGIADQLGFILCPMCEHEGLWFVGVNRARSHEKGWTEFHQGWTEFHQGWPDPYIIHWRPRRITRSGIRRFLMLASQLWLRSMPPGHGRTGPDWYDLWRRIEWVRRTTRFVIRIEIPASLWREDQARLAAKLASAPPIHDDQPSTALLRAEKERALRWTRKRSRLS